MEFKVLITTDIKERAKAFAIRRKVFIEEQNVPDEMEIDEFDDSLDTKHVLVYRHDHAVGTARFRPYSDNVLKIERLAVLSDARRSGVARLIMQTIEAEAKQAGYEHIKLSAQLQAKKLYQQLGFEEYGEVYLDAGIEHVDMQKHIGSSSLI